MGNDGTTNEQPGLQQVVGFGRKLADRLRVFRQRLVAGFTAVPASTEPVEFIVKKKVKSGYLDALDYAKLGKLPVKNPCPPNQNIPPSDLIVVLDLDDCLIHSYPNEEKRPYSQHTYLRPGLVPFLRAILPRYRTHIFTAAEEGYAKVVAISLVAIVGHPFAGCWHSDHCTQVPREETIKDLASLGIGDLSRIVHIDDRWLNFRKNPSNGIPIRPFEDNARDKSLQSVAALLRELEGVEDVRPVLDQRFGLKAALDRHQCFDDWWNNFQIELKLKDRKL